MRVLEVWRERARSMAVEVWALQCAVRDPRVPWYAKALAACVVGYALSPIDLIPDFIPILGYLDDLVLVPLGILAVRRMIPDSVMIECRERARTEMQSGRSSHRVAAAVVITIWILTALAASWLVFRWGR